MTIGKKLVLAIFAVALAASHALAQQPADVPQIDSSKIGTDGTAYLTRVVPVPTTISSEAQKVLARVISDAPFPQTLEQRRAATDRWQAGAGEAAKKLYPVDVAADTIAGVPVRVVTPLSVGLNKRDRVLINLHGGGFNSDSGSLSESVPIANLTGTKVIAVLYRLAPEHPFPAGVDDGIAVYKELLKTYKPAHIAIYGTSAGASLTAEIAVRLKQLNLPMPGALGIFSTLDNFAFMSDSWSVYTLRGFAGHLDPPDGSTHDPYYVGATDLKDPVLSPIYADLHGLPPALFVSSERDALLSSTSNLHRAYLRAGIDARLVVFDGLPHAFWNDPNLPESIEASHIMADFFVKEL